jgi:hypothetical protein
MQFNLIRLHSTQLDLVKLNSILYVCGGLHASPITITLSRLYTVLYCTLSDLTVCLSSSSSLPLFLFLSTFQSSLPLSLPPLLSSLVLCSLSSASYSTSTSLHHFSAAAAAVVVVAVVAVEAILSVPLLLSLSVAFFSR